MHAAKDLRNHHEEWYAERFCDGEGERPGWPPQGGNKRQGVGRRSLCQGRKVAHHEASSV
eukprot:scaffold38694_cov36-Prasinocladus_malaysianus.AAC.1